MPLVNESNVNATAYDRAMGGSWSNPLDPTKTPSISVDVSRVIDEVVDGKTVSTELRRVKNKLIPYVKDKVIDPSTFGMPLPPITHEVLYAYIKALTLDAMLTPEPEPELQKPPTPTLPRFPTGGIAE